jgi:glycosyltransferase involved in cell wall biosynthesis
MPDGCAWNMQYVAIIRSVERYLMTENDIELSVVMPCLDEAETLGTCINKILAVFKRQNINGEVVVGDNGSTDGSQKIARDLGARVVDVSERGYGAALKGGFAAAKGNFLMMGDADDSYDFSEIPKFVEPLRAGADFVIGCRLPSGGGRIMPGAMPPLHRWLGTPVLTLISKIFFSTKIHDINCGMRGFRKDVYETLDLRSSGMEFASEMVMKTALMNVNTVEVPITLHPDGRTREPHLRTWRDGWRHLRFMLLYSPRWLFILPGLFLLLMGLGGIAALATGTVLVSGVGFSTNTQIVSSMCVLLGFQMFSFGLFANGFAVSQGFLPGGSVLDRIADLISLEGMAVFGLLVGAVGIGVLIWALMLWEATGFGTLDPVSAPRIVIVAITLITLGAQIVFSGFILGLLGLHKN